MKAQLFLLNGVSIAVYLVWLGYFYLKSLARAYGNANPSTGPGDVGYVFIIVGIATAACGVYSFFAPAGRAKIVALAPVGLVLAGYVLIGSLQSARAAQHHREQAAETAAREMKLSRISRDYIRKMEERDRYDGVSAQFLTHDRELHTIVGIDVGERSILSAHCVGKINGDVLETFDDGANFEKWLRQYLDPEGKSIFDRYTIRHVPGQDYRDYHLEKYNR